MYEWVLSQGGIAGNLLIFFYFIFLIFIAFYLRLKLLFPPAMEERAIYKSQKLYDVVDQSHKFVAPVQKAYRSRTTAVFKGKGANAAQVEDAFVAKAAARGMEQIRGHRSVCLKLLFCFCFFPFLFFSPPQTNSFICDLVGWRSARGHVQCHPQRGRR